MLEVHRISSDEFVGMREEWTTLLHASPTISPMLSWEWMFSWWQAYQADRISRELYVLVAELDDGVVVGILPLVLSRSYRYGVPLNRLEFIGTGEAEADETCSELLDAIVHPDYVDDVAEAFAGYVQGQRCWDEIVWRDVSSAGESAVGRIQTKLENYRNNKL